MAKVTFGNGGAVDALDADVIDERTMERHVAEAMPLLIKGGFEYASAMANHFDMLAACPKVRARTIRVACSPVARFSGRHDEEQHVAMRFGTWCDHASALTGTDPLADTGALYYLSQCSVRLPVGKSGVAELPELDMPECVPRWLPAAASFGETNLWCCGNVVTTSETHYDSEHNLLCVSRGEKLVALAPPGCATQLKAFPLWSPSAHHARASLLPQEAVANAEQARFSEYKLGCSVVLRAGDALFIPEGWWHSVRSAPRTLAFNFWWPGLRSQVCQVTTAPYLARSLLLFLAAERVVMWRQREMQTVRRTLQFALAGHGRTDHVIIGLATVLTSPNCKCDADTDIIGALSASRGGDSSAKIDEMLPQRPGGVGGALIDSQNCIACQQHTVGTEASLRAAELLASGGTGIAFAMDAALLLLPSQAVFDILIMPLWQGRAVSDARWSAIATASDIALDAIATKWELNPPTRDAALNANSNVDGAQMAFADLWDRVNASVGDGSIINGLFPGRLFTARERMQRRALDSILAELVCSGDT